MSAPPAPASAAPSPVDARRQQLRRDFEAQRGYWTAWLDELLQHSPAFFEAFLNFTSAPWKNGPLSPKVKELVYIAIDAAITHLYQPGLRKHMGDALGHGATTAEIVETLQLASCIGLLSTTTAAPFLLQALRQRGVQRAGEPLPNADDVPLNADQSARKLGFEAATGHWSDELEALLRLDLGAFDQHARYLQAAWQTQALDAVTRELLCIAVHASTTLLHKPGIALHMRRALSAGATQAQIMEVLQLTSVLGIHSCSIGLPILAEQATRSPDG